MSYALLASPIMVVDEASAGATIRSSAMFMFTLLLVINIITFDMLRHVNVVADAGRY